MSQTVDRAREEGRREVNRNVIPLGRQQRPHTTTHFEMINNIFGVYVLEGMDYN